MREIALAMPFSHSSTWSSDRPLGDTKKFVREFQTFLLRETRRASLMVKGSDESGKVMEGRFKMGMGLTFSSSIAR